MTVVPTSPTPVSLGYDLIGSYAWTPSTTPVTMTIPAGSYASAFWTSSISWSGTNLGSSFTVAIISGSGEYFDILYQVTPVQMSGTITNQETMVSAGNLAYINAAAGGAPISLLLSSAVGPSGGSVGPLTLTLTLESSGGGTPTAYTFIATEGPCNNGCNQLMVQLLDSTGKQAAPASTQSFTLSCPNNGISFQSNPLVITNPATNGTDLFCGINTGTYQVTITPGSGPLSAVAAQTISVYVCGSINDNYLAQGVLSGTCKVTRLALRDAICVELFGWCPYGMGQGNQGDLPTGQGWNWANMMLWNQSISETISEINTKSKFHTTVDLSIVVAADSTNGPQFVPLQGVQGCPTEQSINTVRRAVWYDNTNTGQASSPPLTPISFEEQDRLGGTLDNYQPGIPNMFFITGYQIALLPASINGGTLSLYAGTSITQFVGDEDYIDQLPNDYLPVIVLGAAYRIARRNLDKLNLKDMFPELKASYYQGLGDICGWMAEQNEGYQPSFGVSSSRWPGRKMPVVTKKRGSWSG